MSLAWKTVVIFIYVKDMQRCGFCNEGNHCLRKLLPDLVKYSHVRNMCVILGQESVRIHVRPFSVLNDLLWIG